MRRLTTKQRFAFIFSLYVFCFLALLYAIFMVIFDLTLNNQLKKTIVLESKDIINNNLVLDNNELIFKQDLAGGSLKEYLLLHNTSAIFLDKQKNVLRTYGLFAVNNDKNDYGKFKQLSDSVSKNTKTLDMQTEWNDRQLITVVVPLVRNKNIVGFMVVGKSLEEFSSLKQTMSEIFISLGVLNLIGSFLIGYTLVSSTFNPIKRMMRIIDKMELDQLDEYIEIQGHPKDEIVRLARKFNEMTTRLRDMADRQKSFITNASHELKTPLTRAISSLELLSPNSSEDKEELLLMKQDLFHINSMFEKLLLLTKPKKDIQNVTSAYLLRTEVIVAELRKEFEKELGDKKIMLFTKHPAEIKLSIPKEYFLIIIINLLSNAIKYSGSGIRIFLEIIQLDEGLKVIVKDEGSGMTSDELDHMFDRFYRGNGTYPKEKGYGIGLSLVKQICDLYRIDVTTQSEKGTGTTITLRLQNL